MILYLELFKITYLDQMLILHLEGNRAVIEAFHFYKIMILIVYFHFRILRPRLFSILAPCTLDFKNHLTCPLPIRPLLLDK